MRDLGRNLGYVQAPSLTPLAKGLSGTTIRFGKRNNEVKPNDITLRDYFAAAALQGLLANPKLQQQILKTGGAYGGWVEESAYGWADGMLDARRLEEQVK